MANADVQGMLVRIEATTQQLRQELELADRAVASTSSKIDKSLAAVDAAFDRVNTSISQSSGRALDSLAASVEQAQSRLGLLDRELGDIGASAKGFGGAMSSQSRALDELIARIDPAAGALRRLNEQQAALGHFAQSGMLDSAQYASLTASIEAQRKALTGSGQAMHLAGISAGQYTAAMRMLPMQITDVVTSLAGGMPVWMVAIQQGGQIRDMFGGIGNAATAMIGALNPTMLALAAIGAAIAVLTAAYKGAEEEQKAYSQALILSGGAAGATADQVRMLSARMDEMSGVTQRQAAAALGEIAKGGKFAASQLEGIGIAAVAMENATGKAVSDTVKEFTSLAEEPAKASAKLNEQYNYLTVSVYRQIAALEEQGKISEASKLATDAYAVALQQRSVDIEGSLGTLETAWKSIGDIASEAWDAMLNIGRPDTLEQQLDQVERKIKQRREDIYAGSLFDFGPSEDDLRREKTQLELSIQQRDTEAQWRADQAAANKAAISVEQELARQQDQLEKLKGNGSHEQEAIRWIEAHAAATQDDKDRVIARGKAIDEQEAANKREAASTKSATSEAKKHAEALKDYLGKAAVATSAADAMAGAYFAGADSVRELTLQQKVEQELLKTGAGARDAVTAAVKRQQDALDRLDLGKRYADLKLDTDQLHAQAVATLAGVDALQAFNAQKMLSAALAGKNADALSAESQQLLEQIKLNQEAAKAVEQAGKVQGVMDRLYPQQKLLRDYTEEQQALNKAIELYPEKADQYRAALERLGVEYEANKKAGTAWGQWTASALERVDGAFADAWKNIGGGFASFRTSLTDAFRQMLAELAHMAITKPIVLSIGAALGIGGSQQALANGGSGIWGMLGSAGSGSGLFGSVWSGLKSGGLSGALSGAGTWGSGMLSSLDSGAGQLFGSLTGSSSLTHAPLSYQLSNSSLTNLSSSLGYVGTGLAAVGSAMAIYNSYQQQGFKGALVTGGATALGAVFGGPIGAAIGSAVGNFLSGKLFGGSWQTKDYGLALDVSAGDFGAQSYEYQKKKGGLLGSNKSRTRYSDLPADTLAGLEQTWATTESGIAALYEQLGLHVKAGTLDGLQIARQNISTKGKSEEEIRKAVTDWFTKAGESLNTYLNQTFDTGLSYDLAGMTAFVQNLQSVNAMLTNLNVGLFDSTVAGGKMAENLSALAGGFDALSSSVATYYDQFFSAGEKQQDTLDNVTKAFADSSLTLPKTRDGYRAMVEAIDLTTESGRKLFDSLMQMAGQADAYYDVLESRSATVLANIQSYYDKFTTQAEKDGDTLRNVTAQFHALGVTLPTTRDGFAALVDGLNQGTAAGKAMFEALVAASGAADSYYSVLESRSASAAAVLASTSSTTVSAAQGALSALSSAIGAEKQQLSDAYNARVAALNDMTSTASSAVGSLTSISDSLTSALNRLAGFSDQATAILHDQAVAALGSALAFAKTGGSLAGYAGLQDSLDTATSIGAGNYSTLADMQREQGRTANLIAQLQQANGVQLTAEQQLLEGLQSQIDLAKESYDLQVSGLDAQLTAAQSQLDALLGIDSGVRSVGDALAVFTGVLQQAVLLQNATSGITSVTGLDGTKLRVSSGGAILGQDGAAIGLRVEGSQVVGTESWNKGWRLNIGQDGQLSWAAGQQQNIEAWAHAQGIPGFAKGGDFGGGVAMVGERGPELVVTGPSRIYNAGQTAEMLGGSASTAAEVRGLRSDMARVFDALRSIAKHTMQTAQRVESLERWDYDGMPAVRT